MKKGDLKQHRNVLIQGYQNEVFLAERLKRLFFEIKNDEDKAIHNDMYNDLILLIGGKRDQLLKDIAKVITGYMR